ncbi:AlpA family transcriptional regulator [Pseudomonas brassicacearum]|uniref:AlpA family transcriptional regulator n=1 Tax=Pseudomonas brassicacearum TaxID=930166 RepID=A0A423HWG6_9PSED|nr:AlpA family phage regulatory protein [Pseudomonas brassicacearum]RON17565.1 AlpA family transcriptional regulator [Pseudomonas brassicacearum]
MAHTTKQIQAPTETLTVAGPHKFIKLDVVKALTTLSATEIYRRIGLGTFPAQIKFGPKSSAWLENEVLQWQEARIRESRGEMA